MKHFSTDSGSYRNIYSGEKYELPKSDKLDFTEISDESEFYKVLEIRSTKFQVKSSIYKLHKGDDEAKLVREILTKVRFISIVTVIYVVSSFLFFTYMLAHIK